MVFYNVSDEARTINAASVIPTTIEAGTPFSIDFELLDKTGSRLTTGTDSCLYGELQIAWQNDTVIIYDRINREDILFKEFVSTILSILFSLILLMFRGLLGNRKAVTFAYCIIYFLTSRIWML